MLMAVLRSPDPGEVWLALDDINAQTRLVEALCDVFVHSQPVGRRPSKANEEKYASWIEAIADSVETRWRDEVNPRST